MRYDESKSRSTELLKVAIDLMKRHDTACNPHAYAVWYEYAAGLNTDLSLALDACLKTEQSLSCATLERLYVSFIEDALQLSAIRTTERFEKITGSIMRAVAETDASTSQLQQRLEEIYSSDSTQNQPESEPKARDLISQVIAASRVNMELQQNAADNHREIEQLRRELASTRRALMTDSLTQLLNRNGLEARFKCLQQDLSATGRGLTFIMLDLDHFKGINDTFGHLVGDEVIKAVGSVLHNCANSPTQSVARYGGEEFAILDLGCVPGTAVELAEKCRQQVRSLRFSDARAPGGGFTVTISAGIASMPPAVDITDVISRADAALYKAKKLGRDCVQIN
jgi:diguanylate cyclase